MSNQVTDDSMTTTYRTLFDLEVFPQADAEQQGEEILSYFEQPQRPDFDLLDIIHREHDGDIIVTVKRSEAERERYRAEGGKGDPHFAQLAAIPARRLQGFEQMVPALDVDGYATINGMSGGRQWKNSRGYVDVDGSPLRYGDRRKDCVKYLNACFTDLDCYNLGLSVGQAVGTVIDAEAAGRIPRPSVMIDSGTGCWVMWLLRGSNHALHQVRTPDSLPLWEALQGRIHHVLKELGADRKAKDASRVCRIAGSINSKVGRRVSYFPWYNEKGLIATYELEQLALAFGLDPVKVPPTAIVKEPLPAIIKRITTTPPPKKAPVTPPPVAKQNEFKNPKKQRAGRQGAGKRWRNERDRFFQLLRFRHQFAIGTRSDAITVLAVILKKLHLSYEQVLNVVASDLYPHLEQSPAEYRSEESVFRDVGSIFLDDKRKWNLSHVKIGIMLKVTPSESEAVGWPAAGTQPAEPQQPKGRDELRRRRLEHLAALIQANAGEIPGYGALVKALRKAGYPSYRTSVKRDLKALGLSNPRSRDDDAPKLF